MSRMLALVVLLIPACLHAQDAPREVDGAMTINLLQAKRLYDLGAIFIDVRPDREWSWGHIQGAVHLHLDSQFNGLSAPEWPRNLPLVIYCDSDVCPSGAEAAQRAVDWGYSQVFYFRSGYFAWQLADLPLGRGMVGELGPLNAQVP